MRKRQLSDELKIIQSWKDDSGKRVRTFNSKLQEYLIHRKILQDMYHVPLSFFIIFSPLHRRLD